MKNATLAYALMLATAALGPAGVAAGQAGALDLSARKARPASQQQIACTPFGCQPIPRGCRIVTQYDFWGNPTGFDAVICPRR